MKPAGAMTAAAVRYGVMLAALAGSAACAAFAYVSVGLWPAACAVLLPTALLPFHARTRRAWPAPVFLAGMISAAVCAALSNAPAVLVAPGAVLALAAWDLADHDRFVRESGDDASSDARGRGHAASLGGVVALALLPSAAALAFSARIPFAVLLPLVVLDLGCLGYAARLLRK